MKPILTIAILTLIGQTVLAQQQSTWTDIDTLDQFFDRALVEYKTYVDSSINEQAQAFLIPIIQEWPKYRILKNLLKTEVQLDSIVFHGGRTTYLENQYSKTEKFELGVLISTKYYDSKGAQILKEEFDKVQTMIGPCGVITGHYFYNGKKKKKN